MNAEVIQQTVTLWSSDPAKAAGHPTVKAVSEGSGAAVEAGAFSWRAGLPPALGGDNSAPSPTLLLLSALAGCAVVFIRDTLAPQLGVEVEAVEATVRCENRVAGPARSRPRVEDYIPSRRRGNSAAAGRVGRTLTCLPGADEADERAHHGRAGVMAESWCPQGDSNPCFSLERATS